MAVDVVFFVLGLAGLHTSNNERITRAILRELGADTLKGLARAVRDFSEADGTTRQKLFLRYLICIGVTYYSAAMLPFLTDQLIGASSDRLSAVVRWYYWAKHVGFGLCDIILYVSLRTCPQGIYRVYTKQYSIIPRA